MFDAIQFGSKQFNWYCTIFGFEMHMFRLLVPQPMLSMKGKHTHTHTHKAYGTRQKWTEKKSIKFASHFKQAFSYGHWTVASARWYVGKNWARKVRWVNARHRRESIKMPVERQQAERKHCSLSSVIFWPNIIFNFQKKWLKINKQEGAGRYAHTVDGHSRQQKLVRIVIK